MNERTARLVLFIVLSMTVLMVYPLVMKRLFGPQQPVQQQGADDQAAAEPDKVAGDEQDAVADDAEPAPADDSAEPAEPGQPDEIAAAEPSDEAAPAAMPDVPLQLVTIGSLDPASPYRMLVTLTNQGAALERAEFNSPQLRDVEDRTGYIGHLAPADASDPRGCLVRVVGPGTPAANAGLRPGDIITAVAGSPVAGIADFELAMLKTRPRTTIGVDIVRDGLPQSLNVELAWRPLDVIKPEEDSPPSLLMTLAQLDDRELGEDQEELPGLSMRTAHWEVVSSNESEATFRYALAKDGIEILKTYRLAEVPADKAAVTTYPAYHVVVDVEIRNAGEAAHHVAYQLDGPNGLPTEGWWYAYKISPHFFQSVGLRDVVVGWLRDGVIDDRLVSCQTIAAGEIGPPWRDLKVAYIGVDAQYFNSSLIPQRPNTDDEWIAESQPILVGPVPAQKSLYKLANTSCRMTTVLADLEPGGAPLKHQYRLFIGPKEPDLLAHYDMGGVIYYGWFGWVAKPMLAVLHFFYSFLGNYGLAIIALTIVVRSAMFPFSRKAALNAQKMQELQPEIKRIAEKYKNNMEARTKAQQELFKQHNYNPLGGCLIMFIQLPIFIGLYRSLSVDVHLRQAPLISESIRWCSNLAAPDMLFRWDAFMPGFVVNMLGPYFNILPLFTVGLFLMQQKMFMPPPTDEQTRMQQKIMTYMMVFMGFLFFKVASGLCIYFIASSLWGLAERKLLPKKKGERSAPPADPSGKKKDVKSLVSALVGGNGSGGGKAKQKAKSKPRGRR